MACEPAPHIRVCYTQLFPIMLTLAVAAAATLACIAPPLIYLIEWALGRIFNRVLRTLHQHIFLHAGQSKHHTGLIEVLAQSFTSLQWLSDVS